MDYGDIIKRSWRITWRYKALWVLGIFAGVSGCQASGGSSGNSGGSSGNSFQQFGNEFSRFRFERFMDRLAELIPLLVAIGLALMLIGLVIAVLSIAARGGLVLGTNAADEGRRATLTELWGAGFARFWPLLGLDLLLKLPILAVVLVMMAGIAVPIFSAMAAGGQPTMATFAPVCGSLGLGVPLLFVMSFVLGIMYLIALRYMMIGGQGVLESAGNGWRFFRARFKDTFLMWLINAGLNIAASFALAIPMVIVGIGVAVPIVAAIIGGKWTILAGAIAFTVFAIWIIALAYNAIWGTFTSALWTVFFRDVAGLSATAPMAVTAEPVFAAANYPDPVAPSMAPLDAPPMAPHPPADA